MLDCGCNPDAALNLGSTGNLCPEVDAMFKGYGEHHEGMTTGEFMVWDSANMIAWGNMVDHWKARGWTYTAPAGRAGAEEA